MIHRLRKRLIRSDIKEFQKSCKWSMLTKVAESKVKISAEFTLKEVQCAVQEFKTGKCIDPMGFTREGIGLKNCYAAKCSKKEVAYSNTVGLSVYHIAEGLIKGVGQSSQYSVASLTIATIEDTSLYSLTRVLYLGIVSDLYYFTAHSHNN